MLKLHIARVARNAKVGVGCSANTSSSDKQCIIVTLARGSIHTFVSLSALALAALVNDVCLIALMQGELSRRRGCFLRCLHVRFVFVDCWMGSKCNQNSSGMKQDRC